jgi:transposase
VLDKTILSDEEMLAEYKDQSGIEAGFKFIKNNAIGLEDVYLKKPERIAALMAVMTLCLLIYGITQQRLRIALKENDESLIILMP